MAVDALVKSWLWLTLGVDGGPPANTFPLLELRPSGSVYDVWARRELQAQCHADVTIESHEEAVRRHIEQRECWCGIEGKYDWRDWRKSSGKNGLIRVVAEADVWGQIAFDKRHLRAECGRLERLWLLPKCARCKRKTEGLLYLNGFNGVLHCQCEAEEGSLPIPTDWALYAIVRRYGVPLRVGYPPKQVFDWYLMGIPNH